MAARLIFCLILASLIRFIFFEAKIDNILSHRIEIVTPVTSFHYLEEGLFFHKQNLSIYSGEVFHQSPLLVAFFSFLHDLPKRSTNILFIICDLLIGLFLHQITHIINRRNPYTKSISLDPTSSQHISSDLVVFLYLLNPYTILSCVGGSTIIFSNLFVTSSLYFALFECSAGCLLSLSIAAYLSLHPIALLIPLSIILQQHTEHNTIKKFNLFSISSLKKFIQHTIIFCLFMGCLLFASNLFSGSWTFLEEHYLFIYRIGDLQPNIGLFWYFFTELIDVFKPFYQFFFFIHPFLYVFPLTLFMNQRPEFLFWLILLITTIYKAYPSIGDVALYLAFVPMIQDLIKDVKHLYEIVNFYVFLSLMGPAFWNLWIYDGRLNGNFFFASMVTFNAVQSYFAVQSFSHVLQIDRESRRLTKISKKNE